MTTPTKPIKIARGQTFDGVSVSLWSDGTVTYGMGFCFRGVGVAQSAWEIRKDIDAGWMVLGDVSIYDMNEVGRLVKSARRAVRQRSDQPLVAMRRYFDGQKIVPLNAGKTFKWVSA